MHRVSICLTVLLCGLLSCKKSDPLERKSTLRDSTAIDISYGMAGAQKMDVYLPAGRATSFTPFMLVIHGGGWTGGDKGEFNSIISRLKTVLPDYAFFNINYRLFDGNTNQYPAQEEDVKLAANFIFNNSAEFNISNKMVIMGASAGAQLALLQAYKNDQPGKVVAAISFYGPTDMVEFYNNPPSPALQPSLNALFGCSPEQNTWAYQQASPAFFVNSKTPPTLLLHGRLDQLVPVSQAMLLKNKLQSVGIANELVVYPTEGHGWTGASLEDSYNHIQSFLAAHAR